MRRPALPVNSTRSSPCIANIASREGVLMKLIPRIGGTWWPACLVAVLLLLLPLGVLAQSPSAGGGPGTGQGATQGSTGGPQTMVTPGGTVVVNPGGEVLSIGQTEIAQVPQIPKYEFEKPAYFKVEDRQNDEGGAFALLWPQSPDDKKTIKKTDPATGEESENPAYEYWSYHAPANPAGTPGIWEKMDPIPTNSAYVWEQKPYFNKAFFHTKKTLPKDEHYAFFEGSYPAIGVYSYSIRSIPDKPGSIMLSAKTYDPKVKDYAKLEVYANLGPFGGGKVQLDYVPPGPDETRLPWDNQYRKVVELDASKLNTTKAYYILFTARTGGLKKVVLEIQPTRDTEDKDLVLLKGSGSEQSVPDNRDNHFFRLYAVPSGYTVPSVVSFDTTPETYCPLQNAKVIADAINAANLTNPKLKVSATVNPDATITLKSEDPANLDFYILSPDGMGIFGAGKKLIEGTMTTKDPIPEGKLPADKVQITRTEFPPNEWMVSGQVGPSKAHADLWNGARTNAWLWGIFISAAVMLYIVAARKGASLFVRRIAGLDHVDEAIGRATEMGRPILYVTGIGAMSDIATIASVNILGRVGRRVANYESRLLVPSYDPIVMSVCQEVLQEAYIDAGRPDAFKKDDVFFLTQDQFAYAAAVDGIMMRERPATNFLIGVFYAESLLIAETGSSTGAIQIAGTDQMAQLPFLVTACDYTLIGEELYAASAYLSREPMLLGSLKGQDLGKLVLMIWTLLGTIAIFGGIEFFKNCFQAF